jgi:DNA-binding transcriptional regulator YiaG
MKKLWEIRRKKYGPSGTLKRMGKPDPLSAEDKAEIHRLRTKEGLTMQKLANKFQCSVSHIYNTLKANS